MNRKTRKEKIKKAEKKVKDLKTTTEYNSLLEEKKSLEDIIKDNKLKNFVNHISKGSKNTYTFLRITLPFVFGLNAANLVTSGFGFGNLYAPSDYKYFKEISLESDIDGNIEYNESYTKLDLIEDDPTSNLKLYSEYEPSEEGYTRYVRTYDFDSDADIENAILNEDYDYLICHLTDYEEEVETTSVEPLDKGYKLEANIKRRDKSDYTLVPETQKEYDHKVKMWLFSILIICLYPTSKMIYAIPDRLKKTKEQYPIINNKAYYKQLDYTQEQLNNFEREHSHELKRNR